MSILNKRAIAVAAPFLALCALAYADGIYNPGVPSISGTISGGVSSGGGPGQQVDLGTVRWNPDDKSSNLTLSNGNLTATNGAVAFSNVRSTGAGHSYGKYYVETVKVSVNANVVFGIANRALPLTSYVGSTSDGVGLIGDGRVQINSVTINTIAGITNSLIHQMAVDLDNRKVWYRTGCAGLWNNSAPDNPATNTGGVSLATLNAGPYFITYTLSQITDTVTLNSGGSAYACTAPVAFLNW